MWSRRRNADVAGSERDRVATAATEAVGGGTAVDVETSDDRGEAYEVEVRKDDGTEVDVALDKDLNVVSQDAEGTRRRERADDRDDATTVTTHDDATPDADDRVLSDHRAHVRRGGGPGRRRWRDRHRGRGQRRRGRGLRGRRPRADDTEWDVELDADFQVLSKTSDD